MTKNLVDLGNGTIKLYQSLDSTGKADLEGLKTNYENSGSDADLYKFLHKRKKKIYGE